MIAPAVLGDTFSDNERTVAFGVFYLAIPVGSGLGYIIGGEVAELAGDWRWAMRVTPGLNLVAVILVLLFLYDPPRGESDGSKMVS